MDWFNGCVATFMPSPHRSVDAGTGTYQFRFTGVIDAGPDWLQNGVGEGGQARQARQGGHSWGTKSETHIG